MCGKIQKNTEVPSFSPLHTWQITTWSDGHIVRLEKLKNFEHQVLGAVQPSCKPHRYCESVNAETSDITLYLF